MRFLADECVWRTIVERLRGSGFDVKWVAEFDASADDKNVLSLATAEGRILVTEDNDFGDLVFNERRPAIGVVIIQLSRFSGMRELVAKEITNRVIAADKELIGHLTVISPGRERRRRLPSPQGREE